MNRNALIYEGFRKSLIRDMKVLVKNFYTKVDQMFFMILEIEKQISLYSLSQITFIFTTYTSIKKSK